MGAGPEARQGYDHKNERDGSNERTPEPTGTERRSVDPVQLTKALGLHPAAPVAGAQIILAAKASGLEAKCAHDVGGSYPARSTGHCQAEDRRVRHSAEVRPWLLTRESSDAGKELL